MFSSLICDPHFACILSYVGSIGLEQSCSKGSLNLLQLLSFFPAGEPEYCHLHTGLVTSPWLMEG